MAFKELEDGFQELKAWDEISDVLSDSPQKNLHIKVRRLSTGESKWLVIPQSGLAHPLILLSASPLTLLLNSQTAVPRMHRMAPVSSLFHRYAFFSFLTACIPFYFHRR